MFTLLTQHLDVAMLLNLTFGFIVTNLKYFCVELLKNPAVF